MRRSRFSLHRAHSIPSISVGKKRARTPGRWAVASGLLLAAIRHSILDVMKATAILVHEHDVIGQALAVLDAMAARLAGGGSVAAPDVEQLLEFFVVFADRCHHAKEEGILFPALEAAGVPREGGPIGVMLAEHVEGRRLIGRLRQAAPAAASGNTDARRRFAEAAHDYVALLEEHIAKENRVLFPRADGMLTDEDDRRITAAFERHEELEMGPGVHERFHRMLDDLTTRYR